jgi:Dyp-type peroxidase family
MLQAFATVAVPFPAGLADAVENELDAMGNPASSACRRSLDADARVHFMSMSVVRDAGSKPAHLVLELTADGSVEEALGVVARALAPQLRAVLGRAGLRVDPDPERLAGWLLRRNLTLGQGWGAAFNLGSHAIGLPFCGTPGMTVGRIRREAKLAEQIGAMGDLLFGPATPLAKLEAVRERLWAVAAQKWAFTAEPAPFLDPAPLERGSGIGRFLALLPQAFAPVLWPFGVLALALWIVLGWLAAFLLPGAGGLAIAAWVVIGFIAALLLTLAALGGLAMISRWYLERLEASDAVDDQTPNAKQVARIMAHESVHTQNLLASVSTMKPGFFRRMTLRAAFWLIGQENPRVSRPGFLGTMGVIHFARWVLLPGTDKLCFWSNHTGSWESYVEIFIQQEREGVTSIWSNTKGFPRTRDLFTQGAKDGDRLRRWARRQQYRAGFWYSAYPDLTLERIRRNAAIRQGIAAAATDADAADWLACFGSQPRPASVLEAEEIPTLLFGGRRHLGHCACLALGLPDRAQAKAKAWLAGIEPDLTYGVAGGQGSATRIDRALAVAFSASGFSRLGLADEDLATFAPAFQNGMADDGRARALGDVGAHAPTTWIWGNEAGPADAFLVILADDPARLADLLAHHRNHAQRFDLSVVHELLAAPQAKHGPSREPFGFVDGISNPILAGAPRARRAGREGEVLAAGEFVLGYPDSSGYVPPTPLVASVRDPARLLPDLEGDPKRQRPRFAAGGVPMQRDFGRNGSYFVVRQIEQDVRGFTKFTESRGAKLGLAFGPWAGPPGLMAERIAAKMVGRWRNGRPLALDPDPAARLRAPQRENDFLYGRDDPEGLGCPFGAHIRRANPRDDFDPDEAKGQAAIVDRHRILRVGRPYVRQAEGEPAGTLFMCFNADIERQFEFVQQTWLLGRSFNGLEDERDPILGANGRGAVFTIPTRQGPLRLTGLAAFTRVRGGGYFFMPSRRAIRFLCR